MCINLADVGRLCGEDRAEIQSSDCRSPFLIIIRSIYVDASMHIHYTYTHVNMIYIYALYIHCVCTHGHMKIVYAHMETWMYICKHRIRKMHMWKHMKHMETFGNMYLHLET